jgi:predicted house-cleaning noncanonical NTP pyrophosphatase (MazG superfamily)
MQLIEKYAYLVDEAARRLLVLATLEAIFYLELKRLVQLAVYLGNVLAIVRAQQTRHRRLVDGREQERAQNAHFNVVQLQLVQVF